MTPMARNAARSPAVNPRPASKPAKPARAGTGAIAFQGVPGAYSHLACAEAFPAMTPLPCQSFEAAFAAVEDGRAKLAMIPIENSVAGRVAEIHMILPHTGLTIRGEHFQRVNHQLLGVKGARLGHLRQVHSHLQALSQCRRFLLKNDLEARVHADTAGAAADIAEKGDRTQGAIASSLAAEIYGLDILKSDIEDADHNTTRFLVLGREPARVPIDAPHVVTSFVFRVRNVPAALYKALGGFATNGVNMTKIESYMLDGKFSSTMFYADIDAHIDARRTQLALEELRFFSAEVKVLGCYPAHPFRHGDGLAGGSGAGTAARKPARR